MSMFALPPLLCAAVDKNEETLLTSVFQFEGVHNLVAHRSDCGTNASGSTESLVELVGL